MTECHTDSNGRNNRTEVHDEKNDRIILHDCMCIQCSGVRMEDADESEERRAQGAELRDCKMEFPAGPQRRLDSRYLMTDI